MVEFGRNAAVGAHREQFSGACVEFALDVPEGITQETWGFTQAHKDHTESFYQAFSEATGFKTLSIYTYIYIHILRTALM